MNDTCEPKEVISSTSTVNAAAPLTNVVEDMEDLIGSLHQAALYEGKTFYEDPTTGLTVFTELIHLQRGTCCGNICRHCPYGYVNVSSRKRQQLQTTQLQYHPAKVESGDKQATQRLVQQILDNAAARNGSDRDATEASSTTSTIPVNGAAIGSATSMNVTTTTAATGTTTTTKNVPYTKKGDRGTSQLGTGERRSKDDCNFEALGTVDELCSVVGVVHAHLTESIRTTGNDPTPNNHNKDHLEVLSTRLLDIMSRLFDIGSHVAKPRDPGTVVDFTPNGIGDGFDAHHSQDLEVWIDEMTEVLPELTSFILPTGVPTAAHLHVARTVCRRAERRMVPLVMEDQTCDPNALQYLNRLSDFFFVAARMVNYCHPGGMDEIQYQRESPQTTQRQRVTRSLHHEMKE